MMRRLILAMFALILVGACGRGQEAAPGKTTPAPPAAAERPADYLRAVYSPLHFRPAIESATNAQCIECHQEVLRDRVRESSPAGVKAAAAKAWYQQLETYAGEQDTFHRRHLETPLARSLMKLQCNTCHDGHAPREEAPVPPSAEDAGYTLRKQVNPETTCLKCHGAMPYQLMGLPAPWPEIKASFGNSCLTCHASVRTVRHQVSYLDAAAIEKTAREKGSDVCYGCHGGRAWYRIAYPYPRHAWPAMSQYAPPWAAARPTESEARFRLAAAIVPDAPAAKGDRAP
jgi:nitrate/TMAO reductase-like tetraheme cytochrome c subunit